LFIENEKEIILFFINKLANKNFHLNAGKSALIIAIQ